MAQKTAIEWCDSTWNPITGCSKISPACDHCYAERMSKRLAGRCGYQAENSFSVTFHPDRLTEPLKWKNPRRIFVCSMGDLFHEDVPFEWTDKVFAVLMLARQHTFMLLTKRPGIMRSYFSRPNVIQRVIDQANLLDDEHDGKLWSPGQTGISWPLPNVWLGITVEDQQRADERIPLLLQCPAMVRFVSYEPALGPVDFTSVNFGIPGIQDVLNCVVCERLKRAGISKLNGIDWIIAGGETGPNARPAHPDWFRAVRDQCQAAGVPYFFKGWGDWGPAPCIDPHTKTSDDALVPGQKEDARMICVGKKHSGRLLDGREWNEIPEARS